MTTKLTEEPLIAPDVVMSGSELGRWTQIGASTRLLDTVIGDYSYCDRLCDFAHTDVGRFSNIASAVRVGATDHPLEIGRAHV